jgi:hypothetical protein
VDEYICRYLEGHVHLDRRPCVAEILIPPKFLIPIPRPQACGNCDRLLPVGASPRTVNLAIDIAFHDQAPQPEATIFLREIVGERTESCR